MVLDSNPFSASLRVRLRTPPGVSNSPRHLGIEISLAAPDSDGTLDVDVEDLDDFDDIVPLSPASRDLILSDHYLSQEENHHVVTYPSDEEERSDTSGECISNLQMVYADDGFYDSIHTLIAFSCYLHSVRCIDSCEIEAENSCDVATWQPS